MKTSSIRQDWRQEQAELRDLLASSVHAKAHSDTVGAGTHSLPDRQSFTLCVRETPTFPADSAKSTQLNKSINTDGLNDVKRDNPD